MSNNKKIILVIKFLLVVGLIFFTIGIITTNLSFIKANETNKINTATTKKTYVHISKWITIPTYNNLDEVVHPKVLQFNNEISGYKYWMVSTPYARLDEYNENPQITVSNDGINWIKPANIKNPVSGYPSKKFNGTYYSDPFLIYDEDYFKLFFRKTKSYLNVKYKRNGYNYLYKIDSNDGINWGEKKLILDNNPNEQYMSPSIIKENDLYKIWYVNYNGKVRYIESKDLIRYTKPINILVNNFDKKIWHGELQKIGNKYIFIYMIKYKLYYTESSDGINFESPKLIKTDLKELIGKKYFIYKTSYIISDGYIKMYISYRFDKKWHMYYLQESLEKFYKDLQI